MPKLHIILIHPIDSFSSVEPVLLFSDNDSCITATLANIAIGYAAENGIDTEGFSWIDAFNDIPDDYWKAHGITLIGIDDAISADGWEYDHLYEADCIDDYA